MRLPLIEPMKKQQLTITPFLYLNQGLIEIRKIEVAPSLRSGIFAVRSPLKRLRKSGQDVQM